MAADSTQPGPGASPTDTPVHGAKSLPGPRARAGGAAPSQPSPPGARLPPIHTRSTLQALCLKTEMFFKSGPYHRTRWQQLGSSDYY